MWRVSAVLLAAGLVCGMAVWWSRPAAPTLLTSPWPGRKAWGITSRDRAVVPGSVVETHGRRHSRHERGILQDSIVVASCSLGPVGQQDVSSQVDGVFRAVLVDLGQQVTRGRLLGRLDDRQLRPQVDLLK